MDILQYSFFQNALIGVILVSIISAMVGTYIVARRQVFITGGITHACFGGLGLGYFLSINPIFMAAVFAVASSLGVEWMSQKQRIREDSAIAVIWAFGMAIGTIFIFLSPGYVPELSSFLFGNILTITHSDLVAFLIFTLVFTTFFVLRYRAIIACAFDKDFANTIGLPATRINYIMSIMVAICVVLTIRLIGIMLLMSLLTMPQMIAELYSKRLKNMIILSVIISLLCSITGLFASYFIGVPASAVIVLTLIVLYALSRCYLLVFKQKHIMKMRTR